MTRPFVPLRVRPSLHDSPLRSCQFQSNGSQMVEPGSPRPVTKAGQPSKQRCLSTGDWHGCAGHALCVCVCVVWSATNGGRHPGNLPGPFSLSLSRSLSLHLRKRGPSIFIHCQYCNTTYGSTRVFPPFPLRSWNLSWRPSPPYPGLLD